MTAPDLAWLVRKIESLGRLSYRLADGGDGAFFNHIDPEMLNRTLQLSVFGQLVEAGQCNAEVLGSLYQGLLEYRPSVTDTVFALSKAPGHARKTGGSYYTPEPLIDCLLDLALEPLLAEVADAEALLGLRLCDPACGSGLFLVAAGRRIARRLAQVRAGLEPDGDPEESSVAEAFEVVSAHCLYGVDIDPVAVLLARYSLGLATDHVQQGNILLGAPAQLLREAGPTEADAWSEQFVPRPAEGFFHAHLRFPEVFEQGGFDLVVGNPPFLNQLQVATTNPAQVTQLLVAATGGAVGPYTDLSAVFLARSLEWVRPGGCVGLVQPQSVLAARDAAPVRRRVAEVGALVGLWASDKPVFDVPVLTCAPVVKVGTAQGSVVRRHGLDFATVPARDISAAEVAGEWGFLIAAGLGIPEVSLSAATGVLAERASCTADFRDQFYGLAPFVREVVDADPDARCAPLVTTGLIDPAELLWGTRTTRFNKVRWEAPVVDLTALEAAPALAQWARNRLVPKVLVGTQSRVIEAVVDVEGHLLPSVPTVTVVPAPEDLWLVLAVLLAPPIAAHAATKYAGTALSMQAIKLSASQVGQLPLPLHAAPWVEAAALLEQAQRDADRRRALLLEAGALLCTAYGVDDPAVLAWWEGRLRPGPA